MEGCVPEPDGTGPQRFALDTSLVLEQASAQRPRGQQSFNSEGGNQRPLRAPHSWEVESRQGPAAFHRTFGRHGEDRFSGTPCWLRWPSCRWPGSDSPGM